MSESGGLVLGRDYYLEDGLFVFTAHYHRQRGYCCRSGCRHCPYDRPEPRLGPVLAEPSIHDVGSTVRLANDEGTCS